MGQLQAICPSRQSCGHDGDDALFSEAARIRQGWGAPGRRRLEERQIVGLFLNPSGHLSCQRADGSWENEDWQALRHLSGSPQPAKWAGVQVAESQGQARGSGTAVHTREPDYSRPTVAAVQRVGHECPSPPIGLGQACLRTGGCTMWTACGKLQGQPGVKCKGQPGVRSPCVRGIGQQS